MSAVDYALKHAQYNVFTAACVLVTPIAARSELLVATIVVGVISYCWGSVVAWRVSKYIYAHYNHNFKQQQSAVYAAWFASWLGAFVLLVWLHELERTAHRADGLKAVR